MVSMVRDWGMPAAHSRLLTSCRIVTFTFSPMAPPIAFCKVSVIHLLHLIHGLTFSYRHHRVDYVRSLWKAGVFYLGTGLRRNIEQHSAGGRSFPAHAVRQ